MAKLRNLAIAPLLATGAAGTAAAAPVNLGNVTPPTAGKSEAAAPVYHGRRCWPLHRWEWTHWGWRYRHVGHRCAPRHYYYPYYRHY